MRAAIFSEHGGPDVVRVAEVDTPEPGAGEVRVRVHAASMNHLDLWTRRGLPIEITMPHIGGSDIAGTVDALGPGVHGVPGGTRVAVDPSLGYEWYTEPSPGPSFAPPPFRLLGEHTQGGFAQYAVVPAANLLEIPEGVSFEDAAAAGLVGVTAWRGLLSRGGLSAGESVLITGASGGVSTMAIQIAAMAGARVYAVTSGEENVARVRKLGADVVYDRTQGEWGRQLWKDTGKRGVDLVLDSVGQALWPGLLKCLAPMGRLVTFGATTGALGETEIRLVFWRQLSILGSTMGTPGDFREAMHQVFAGRIRPVVHQVLSLDQVRKGHEMLEAGEVFGKLVVTPWT